MRESSTADAPTEVQTSMPWSPLNFHWTRQSWMRGRRRRLALGREVRRVWKEFGLASKPAPVPCDPLGVALQHLELGYRLSDPAEHFGNLASDVDALLGLLPSSVRRTLLPHRQPCEAGLGPVSQQV
jgi:hypothetical protein